MSQSYSGVKFSCLEPCPKSPNCVSTQSEQLNKRMEALPFISSTNTTKNLIKEIVQEMGRNEIKDEALDYLHVVFSSKWLKFKDDVEFYLDNENELLHFRSASRVGSSDFNVNRKRMENFSVRYKQKHKGESSL
ncbi:DUF1499 domain-containing protein [Halobacillus sp. A5]|uniref:DUF1499 domain-containing protein n=1 Tax=Halobacillus sp. A5 TaxID=2880263 RepID=UPI0020A63048|nr:DUF1499 domain-containing protein [Halobacillus sp. A5]MCP3026815.1 DUF1499 domain-containing protein [Halobacillus sp. A5]